MSLLRAPRSTTAVMTLTMFTALSTPPDVQSCMYMPPSKSDYVDLDLGPNVVARATIDYYTGAEIEGENQKPWCSIYASMPLSAFPASNVRMSTGELADAVAEAVQALAEEAAVSCNVWIEFGDDVSAEYAAHELCVNAEFVFEQGRSYSQSSESYCWDPADMISFEVEAEEMPEESLDGADEPVEDALYSDDAIVSIDLADFE